MAFLNSILKNSSNHKIPFEHWELNQPLTDGHQLEVDLIPNVQKEFCDLTNFLILNLKMPL